jgi:subtilisin family serine protease
MFSLILSVLVAGTAQAGSQRVLVIMKDKTAFQTANATYKARGAYALKGFKLGGTQTSLSQVDGAVEDSLENLNTLVISTSTDAEVDRLKADPSVAYVEQEYFHEAPRPMKGWLSTQVARNSNFKQSAGTPWGIVAVKAPDAWKNSDKGQGARVLVLDTGIDQDHPSLKANFEKGQDFVGDNNAPYAYADHVGHGTHVSGTIAGAIDKTGFTGVAPKAKILMGRVCSEQGCSNISIAQGINWGIKENVDVISMSLGGSMSTPAERSAVASAYKAGVTVVAASGNDGSSRVSYPAALSTVIAVGAVDSSLKKADFSQYGPELAVVAPGVAVVSSVPQGSGRDSAVTIISGQKSAKVTSTTFQGAKEVLTAETNVLVNAGLGKPEELAKVDVKGKFALISRGEIKFSEKVANAIKAGAAGIVIYNNAPGLIHGALTDDGSTLPVGVFMIEQAAGNEIVGLLTAGKEVKATIQTIATDYSAFDGTSMATPHVAGVVALMKAANKKLLPAQVKAILTSTATALGPNTNNEYGAGLVNADAAVSAALSAPVQAPLN